MYFVPVNADDLYGLVKIGGCDVAFLHVELDDDSVVNPYADRVDWQDVKEPVLLVCPT